MLLALDEDRRAKAILNPNKTDNNNLTEAFKDNVVLDYAGARVRSFLRAAAQTAAGPGRALRRQHGRRPRRA